METTEFAPTVRMHHATRAKAVRLIALLEAEYPAITLRAVDGDSVDHEKYAVELAGWEVVEIATDEVVWEGEALPEIADVLDACADAEVDPIGTSDEDHEPKASASVVPEKYRQAYRNSSTGQSCGDWLADVLATDTLDADLKLNVDALTRIFEANGLDMTAKWAMGRVSKSSGWQGRYRMSGRNILEKHVLEAGFYVTEDGRKLEAPAEWLERMGEKHGKWLAKQRKLQEARDAAIRESVEGATQAE